MRISTKFTYEDLQAIPPDRNRYEIVDGELIVTAAPIPLHQRILRRLTVLLDQHIQKHGLGEIYFAPLDIVFSPGTVLEPDLIFIRQSRLHIIGEKNLTGPPDLVVEVLSDSTVHLDRQVKPKQFALYGVPEFWLIDPVGKTVEIFRLREGAYELAMRLSYKDDLESPLFPGLTLPVSSLWES
jgi:Uma2 family endonuclease